MQPDINVKVESSPEGYSTLVIRKGEALPLREPATIKIEGTIDAPKSFFEKREERYQKENCHVIINEEAFSIELHLNEQSPFKDLIIGSAKLNPELLALGVLTKGDGGFRQFNSTAELAKHIKFMKNNFDDVAHYTKVIESMEKFKIKYSTQIEKMREQNGNKRDEFEVIVDSSTLQLNFTLKMPIFIGGKPEKFLIEIQYDLRSNGVSLWLESIELASLIKSMRKKMFGDNILFFEDKGLPVIFK